ncbi:hypothetical protein KEM52_002925 [Ascosphaera acerosa]|nr:hypothetical protein KEM52_002925 [Ascosphaera acerosa]
MPSRKSKTKRAAAPPLPQHESPLPPVTGHLRSLAEIMGEGQQRDDALSALDELAIPGRNATYAGGTAAVTANVVLVAYLIVAWRDDQEERAQAASGRRRRTAGQIKKND